MRIKLFRFIIEETAQPHILRNCSLVIDAQNFFYNCYRDSSLRFEFGADCDRYAEHVKAILSRFKKANIKCYFIFKGGTKNLEKKIFNAPCQDNDKLVYPIFMSDIHLQVLKELEFDYLFTEFECKSDCMTLARKLSCPVISDDIEFPLSGIQYISKTTLTYDEDKITCKLFSINTFLRRFRLDKNKVALFILLTDEKLFPEKSFDDFFYNIRIPTAPKYRNKKLLQWLSKPSEQQILTEIFKVTHIAKEQILEELTKVKKHVRGEINSGIANDYFFNKHKINDWFVVGVAANHIAKTYIDLYRSNILLCIKFGDTPEVLDLSLNIIKYAYDLLTNFKNEGLKMYTDCVCSQTKRSTIITKSIKNPCEADQTVFENGWNNILSLGLFHHFILETTNFDCVKLNRIPDDAKMLIITLVYIFHNTKSQSNITTFTTEMAHGVLLSYVLLGAVKERVDDSIMDQSLAISDCKSAVSALADYFDVDDVSGIMDEKLRIPLMQFQCCLLEMNNLNKLCGSPFESTNYGKTYNATFVYKVIYTMRVEGIIPSVSRILNTAPTVLTYFEKMIELYDSILQSIE